MADPVARGPNPFRAAALDGLPHGFFGREGGVSIGEVAGLQVGFGASDDPAAVAENRARAIAAVLPGADLAMPYQVHSAEVAVVAEAVEGDERPHVDALVTGTPGLLVGVFTTMIASGRFVVEFFREPDAQLSEFALRTGLSMGQWLTIPLILAGLALVAWALSRKPLASGAGAAAKGTA